MGAKGKNLTNEDAGAGGAGVGAAVPSVGAGVGAGCVGAGVPSVGSRVGKGVGGAVGNGVGAGVVGAGVGRGVVGAGVRPAAGHNFQPFFDTLLSEVHDIESTWMFAKAL